MEHKKSMLPKITKITGAANRVRKKIIVGIAGKRRSGVTDANPKKEGNIDYNVYRMPTKEKILNIIKILPFIYVLSYLFYKSHVLSIILSFSAFLYPSLKVKEIINKRKEELNIQFKDMLYSIQSSLWAGKPIEIAFIEAAKDLRILYPNSEDYIILESSIIAGKIKMNETVEKALMDFGQRSGIDDIQDFAEVLHICKRTGGNLVEVVKKTTGVINDKIQMKQDINTMLAKRNFERKVLNFIPVVILALLCITSGDYIRPIYEETIGRIVMTVSVILIIAAYFISKRIMDIEI